MIQNPRNAAVALLTKYLSRDQLAKLETPGIAQALTPEELARSVLYPNNPRHDFPQT